MKALKQAVKRNGAGSEKERRIGTLRAYIMTELNEDFAYCVEKFGIPVGGERVDPRVIEAYRSRVPDSMLAFWKECGVGLWLNGKFQLVSPDRYRGLLNLILQDDPDYPPDQSVLIGYGAFGKLLIWNNEKYTLEVDLVKGIAYTTFPNPRFNLLAPDLKLPSEISDADSPIYDCRERTDAAKPLFTRAVKTYGKLAYGECYGFVPAVGLGGRGVLEDVQRVRALEHFSILAQLGPIELRYMDTENRKIVVLRELGG